MSDDSKKPANSANKLDRREFIGAAAATAGIMFIKPSLVRGTAANSAVRVGLLGCGGRGTEDATNMIDTGGARVVALADMFQDQLDTARAAFRQDSSGQRLLSDRYIANLPWAEGVSTDRRVEGSRCDRRCNAALLSPAAPRSGRCRAQACVSREARCRRRGRRVQGNRNRQTSRR